jgi:hypothetical protein
MAAAYGLWSLWREATNYIARVLTAQETEAAALASPAVAPRRVAGWLGAHLSVIALALPLAIGLIRLVVALPRPFLSGGDVAFIELAIRRALGGDELLGPYSRFGWHHPGPAMFYIFSPVYALSGARSRALFLDAWLLNGTCALGAVLVLRHRLGERSARLGAAVIGMLLVLLGFKELINPWNPSLLCLPLLLLLVLSADAAAGSAWSLAGAAVVGSFLVQTHLGLLPVVGVALACAAGSCALVLSRRRRAGGNVALWRPVLVGVGLFSVMWVGPAIQQVTGNPGNIGKLVAFFRHPPAGEVRSHSFRDSFAAISNHAAAPLLGPPSDERLRPWRASLVVGVAIGGLLAAVAARKTGRQVVFLGAASGVGLVVAVVATTRVIGGFEPYLFAWTPALLVPGIAAVVLATAAGPARMMPRLSSAAGVVALAAMSLLMLHSTVHAATTSYGHSPDAVAAARQIEQVVGDNPRQVFRIRIVDGQFQTASMLLQLVLDGYRYKIDPPYGLYEGNSDREPATGAPTIIVGTQASVPPPAADALPATGPIVLWTSKAPGESVRPR